MQQPSHRPLSDRERQLLIGWRKLYPHVAETAFLQMEDIGNQVMRAVAATEGVDLIDIDALFPKTEENFADHVHFTTAGAEQMAELLARNLLALFLNYYSSRGWAGRLLRHPGGCPRYNVA